MKTLNFLGLLLLFLSACAPEVPPPPTEQVEEVLASQVLVADVRKNEIDQLLSDAHLRYDSLRYTCKLSQDGGILRLFKAGDSLHLIRHLYHSGEHSSGQIDLYIDRGHLFYAEVEESLLTFDAEAPQENDIRHTREDISRYRYYFDAAGQPLRCLQKAYFLRSSVELPTNPDQIAEVEINSSGGAVLQAFFKQVERAQDETDLLALFCAN